MSGRLRLGSVVVVAVRLRLWCGRSVRLWRSVDRRAVWGRRVMMVAVASALPWVPSVIKLSVNTSQDGCTGSDHFLREGELLAVEYEGCSILCDHLIGDPQGVVEIGETLLLLINIVRAGDDTWLDRVIDVVSAGGQFFSEVLDAVVQV